MDTSAEKIKVTLAVSQVPAAPNIDISIVIPVYNEEANLALLRGEIEKSMASSGLVYELILVNDGSRDRTGEIIAGFAREDSRIVAIEFWRNYGQTAAVSAGIEAARGRIIIPMDGDLQNDPNDIPRLIEKINEGHDVVSGWRRDRHDETHRVIASKVANKLISIIGGVPLHDLGCSLKAYRRDVIKGVRLYGEMHRFIPLYAVWQGGRVTELVVNHRARVHGVSNYNMTRTFKVILDLLVVRFLLGYMSKPIYVFGGCGLLSLLISSIALLAAVIFKLIPAGNAYHKDLSVTPLPLIGIGMFIVGVQLILMGLLAELQMRTYYESQNLRPYRVKNIVGGDRPAANQTGEQ